MISLIELIHFGNPKVLWLILAISFFVFVSYVRGRRSKISAIIRILCIFFIILGISDPFLSRLKSFSGSEYLLLIDNSASMTAHAIASCISQAEKFKKDKSEKIIYFSDYVDTANTNSKLYRLTNYEKVFLEVSEKYVGSDLVLCTDGNETQGNFLEVATKVKNSFSSISILYPELDTVRGDDIRVSNVQVPLTAQKADNPSLRFTLKNMTGKSQSSKYELLIDGERFREISLSLPGASERKVEVPLTSLKKGPHKITIKNASGEELEASWITILEPPTLLILSHKGEKSLLLEKMLAAFNYEYTLVEPTAYAGTPKINRDDITGVIINNLKASELSTEIQKSIEQFVLEGGTSIILGGDSSYGLGGYQNSIIEKFSPLKSVPPRPKVAKAPSAVIMVFDKSGSMGEQGKLHAAKLAAMSSIMSLKPDDYAGVIAFDYAPLSVIDLDVVEKVKTQARERLASLTAYGQTNLLPALSLARLRLSKINAGKKHLIVLSDGRFPASSDSFVSEINRLRADGITVSTVALGYEADGPFMKMLAEAGKGSFYQVIDAAVLPKLFIDDIKVRVGEDTMKEEGPYRVTQKDADSAITALAPLPDVLGFVETEAKSGVSTHVEVTKSNGSFPLLAFWTYQKGKVLALSSDLQGRWNAPWLRWPRFTAFWSHYFKKVFEQSENINKKQNYEISYSVDSGRLLVGVYVYDALLESRLSSQISVSIKSDTDEIKTFLLNKKVKGRFEGYTDVSRAGDYDVKLTLDDPKEFKVAILAKDLGEKVDSVNFEFLSKMKNALHASLSKIDFKNRQAVTVEQHDRSTSITFELIYAGLLLLVLEVFVRERKKF